MDRHPNDHTTDEQIDAAMDQAKQFDSEPRIVEAIFRSEPELDLLLLKLSDGRRLLFPREELPELRNATPRQAADFIVGRNGRDLWWPLLDDGIYLPNLLQQTERSGQAELRNSAAA